MCKNVDIIFYTLMKLQGDLRNNWKTKILYTFYVAFFKK